MAVLLLAWPVMAQEQRGSIEGTIKDNSGALLPGVTVEAKSATGAVLSTTTGSAGEYRFPSVAPGTYEISANLASFSPTKISNVSISLGETKTIEITMAVAGVAENVQVTAEPPLVDIKGSGRATSIRAEQIDLLPKGRDFLTVVTQAPGTNNEPKSGGIMIDGATAGENRYVIDGAETTDLVHGTSGKNLLVDFLEEVQIKSSGYTAEYGGSTGGVINAITKSGTNKFSGSALFNWEGSALAGQTRTLRTKLTDSTQAEYIEYPKDDRSRFEPGFAVGGPIMKDRQWFFVAYQPAITNLDRAVNASTSGNPSANSLSSEQKLRVQNLSANHSAQLGSKLRTRVAYNSSWNKQDGLLPSLNGTDPLEGSDINYLKKSKFPNWALSGTADYLVSPSFMLGARASYFLNDQHDSDVPNVPRVLWTTTNNINFVGTNGVPVPANLQRGTNFTSVLSNTAVDHDKLARSQYQVDATWFGRFAGQHSIKGGVQIDRRTNDVLSAELGHRVTVRWGSSLSGNRGPFGYYSVRSAVDSRSDVSRYGGAAAADALRKNGFVTSGLVSSNLLGLFVQDAWNINDRLTLNLGLRTENEEVPIYGEVPGITANPIEFSFGQKLAPRVGASYDLLGDGRNKVYGSWGIYYDIFKMGLPRGSYGGDKWIEYYYTLDNPNWPTLDQAAGCTPSCSGTLFRITDFRLPTYSTTIDDCAGAAGCTDPNLDPMRSQEFSAGYERQLGRVMAVGIRYVHKQLDKGIEDVGAVFDGNEVYVIGNPGFGTSSVAHVDSSSHAVIPLPKAQRDYDSVEFTFAKRQSDNWQLFASYLWSRLEGNYPGLSQTDENGRTDPNVGRLFDYPLIVFQQNGTPAFGPLPTDRPHQVKAQFVYSLPFGTTFGVNQFVSSGIPVTGEIGVLAPSNFPMQWRNRGSDGRTDVLSQTDLSITHVVRFSNRSLQFNFNVLNLFNQEAVINKFSTYHAVNGVTFDEDAFYRGQVNIDSLLPGVVKDPRYLQPNGFQTPIQARFGVKFMF
jgi:hypothetical protein